MKEYENWMNYRMNSKEEPVTRTQSLFAKEIFNNEILVGNKDTTGMLAQPGDLQEIFKSIQKYLKDK